MTADFFTQVQDPIWNVLIRFLVNVLVLFIVIRLIYYRYTKRKGYVFSFFLMGIMIFMVCILLKTVEIQLGIALGLFAIFAITRFRSRNLSLRTMSYFFTVIGIAVINAMANFIHPVRGTILINGIIICTLLILEYFYHRDSLTRLEVDYDRLELLNPDKEADLISDISLRTGKKVERVKVRKIDLTKGKAELDIFYRDTGVRPS